MSSRATGLISFLDSPPSTSSSSASSSSLSPPPSSCVSISKSLSSLSTSDRPKPLGKRSKGLKLFNFSPSSTSRPSVAPSMTVSRPKATEKRKSKENTQYYRVEDILGRRVNKFGLVEYLLKWEGYPDHCNSWEESSNLTSDLLVEFESNSAMEQINQETLTTSYILKEKPLKIMDIRKVGDNSEDLEFSVLFENEPKPEWVPAQAMRTAYSNMVIRFYEKLTRIHD